jgi:Ca-activated chloride channel family protein
VTQILQHGFTQPLAFALLGVLPILAVFALVAWRRRRRALVRFGTRPALHLLAARRSWLRSLRGTLWLSALLSLVAGIAGPRWGRDWQQTAAPGRDLVLVLDLSRSMLAQDVLPSRLGRAKQALEELTYTIQKRGGHRLGLVAFAAGARIVCPLTHDYDFVRSALEELDAAHLPPELRADSTSVSGTRIGAGLRAAIEAHDERFRGAQDILLISDGDDPARDGEWRQGMAEARRQHIPVHTVGIGDPEKGGTIQVRGQDVVTRLDEVPLEAIARLTGGKYTPARTQELRLGELFLEYIEPGTAHEEVDDLLPVYEPRFSWFFGSTFGLLALDLVLGQRWPRLRRCRGEPGETP